MTQSQPTVKVFVAEDSGAIRTRLLEMLDAVHGVVVVGESDSLSGAIDGIRRTSPDTVVLDIRLVGGSGLEVLRRMHPLSPHIRFIVLTNHPDEPYRAACLKEGASHFLDKSHEFGKVREIVSSLRSPALA